MPPPEASTSSTSTTKTISASAYISLAPHLSTRPFAPSELRALVIDYLCSACYPDSAKAFAAEVERSLEEANRKEGDEGAVVGGSSTDTTTTTTATAPARGLAGLRRDGDGTSTGASSAMEGVEGGSSGEGTFEDAVGTGFDPDGEMRDGDEDMDDGDEDGRAEQEEEEEQNGEHTMDEVDQLDEERDARYSHHALGKSSKTISSFVSFDGQLDNDIIDGDQVDWPLLSVAALREVRIRKLIREHILKGRISSALELLHDHFPSVLDPIPVPPSSHSPPSQSKNPCSPREFFVLTPSLEAPSAFIHFSSSSPDPTSTFPPSALSLSSHILALNLQVQSFIELMRSPNLSSPTPASSPPPPPLALESSTSSIQSTRSSFFSKAIADSQAIRKRVSELTEEKEREEWEKECVMVAGLLAYTDFKGCPANVKAYLDEGRKSVLAELVDAAVLQRVGKTPVSLLGMVARQTAAVWSTVGEFKVAFPPSSTGASTTGTSTNNGNGAQTMKEKSRSRAYPRFSLAEFLSEREVALADRVGETESAPRMGTGASVSA